MGPCGGDGDAQATNQLFEFRCGFSSADAAAGEDHGALRPPDAVNDGRQVTIGDGRSCGGFGCVATQGRRLDHRALDVNRNIQPYRPRPP